MFFLLFPMQYNMCSDYNTVDDTITLSVMKQATAQSLHYTSL